MAPTQNIELESTASFLVHLVRASCMQRHGKLYTNDVKCVEHRRLMLRGNRVLIRTKPDIRDFGETILSVHALQV